MTESKEQARARREAARLALVEEAGFTCVSVGAFHAGAEYGERHALEAARDACCLVCARGLPYPHLPHTCLCPEPIRRMLEEKDHE